MGRALRRTAAITIALALASGLPAAASTQNASPPTTVEGVTVLGERHAPTPNDVSTAIRTYAKPSRIGQMSRWETPLCVRTMGLPDAYNAFVTSRVGEVAEKVGAPRATGCEGPADVIVVFTTEPQALLDDVRAHHPELLGFHYRAQSAGLAHFDGPIEAWHATASTAGDGEPHLDNPFEHVPSGSSASRLSTGLKSQFAAVLVVADATRVAEQPVGEVADFIAMLVLTRPVLPAPCGALPSVLDAFNDACGRARAAALTDYDEAFLKGLYATHAQTIAQQRSEVFSRMRREVRERR